MVSIKREINYFVKMFFREYLCELVCGAGCRILFTIQLKKQGFKTKFYIQIFYIILKLIRFWLKRDQTLGENGFKNLSTLSDLDQILHSSSVGKDSINLLGKNNQFYLNLIYEGREESDSLCQSYRMAIFFKCFVLYKYYPFQINL